MTTNSEKGVFALDVAELGPTLAALHKQGVTLEHLAMLRSNNGENDYARRIGRAFTTDDEVLQSKISIAGMRRMEAAKRILGDSFIDLDTWYATLGVRPTNEELEIMADFPWSEDEFNQPCPYNAGKFVKDTHVVFFGISQHLAGKPLTLWAIDGIRRPNDNLKYLGHPNESVPWFGGNDFAKTTLRSRWHLMLADAVPGSVSKTPAEQDVMMAARYEVPTAITEAIKNILVYAKSSRRPNSGGISVRCRDTFPDRIGGIGGTERKFQNYPAVATHSNGQVRVYSFGPAVSRVDIGVGAMRWW